MKMYFKKIVFLLAFMITLFTACKDDDDGIGFEAGSGKVTASIDGTNWESKDEIDGAVFAASQGSNIIQAHAADGSYISLTLFGTLSSGLTLNSDTGLFQASYKPDFLGMEAYSGIGTLGSGSTTITNFSSTNIQGTFQFTGGKINPDGSSEQIVISNGSYNIDY